MEAFNLNSYIPFLGIKQDKILCEKMMQQYRKEYPVNFHSPSKNESSFEKHQNNPKYQAINRNLSGFGENILILWQMSEKT